MEKGAGIGRCWRKLARGWHGTPRGEGREENGRPDLKLGGGVSSGRKGGELGQSLLPPLGAADPGRQRATGVFRDPQSPAPHTQGRGADPPLRSSLPAPKVRAHPPRDQVLPEAGLGLGALICPTWHLNSVSHWDASHLRLDGIFPKVHVLRPVLCRRGTPWPHPASAGQDAQGQRRRNPLGSCCSFLGVGRGFQ